MLIGAGQGLDGDGAAVEEPGSNAGAEEGVPPEGLVGHVLDNDGGGRRVTRNGSFPRRRGAPLPRIGEQEMVRGVGKVIEVGRSGRSVMGRSAGLDNGAAACAQRGLCQQADGPGKCGGLPRSCFRTSYTPAKGLFRGSAGAGPASAMALPVPGTRRPRRSGSRPPVGRGRTERRAHRDEVE